LLLIKKIPINWDFLFNKKRFDVSIPIWRFLHIVTIIINIITINPDETVSTIFIIIILSGSIKLLLITSAEILLGNSKILLQLLLCIT
jgi:hypothetical protein